MGLSLGDRDRGNGVPSKSHVFAPDPSRQSEFRLLSAAILRRFSAEPRAAGEVYSGMSDPTSNDTPEKAPEADEASTRADGPFSLSALRELVELMEKHGLTEVSLKTGETQWKLRRGPEVVPGYAAFPAAYAPPPPAQAAPPTAPAATPAAGAPPAAQEGILIKSPTVGTFYAAAGPDDPPFVTVGTRVEPDTIVCLVEAMKVFNQIPAEVSGVIAEVLVKNGDSIEFGQPLFRVK